jgi:hypothetical protein
MKHPFAATLCAALAAAALLTGCDLSDSTSPTAPSLDHSISASVAESEFNTLVADCTAALEKRSPYLRQDALGQWVKTGHSPALVQSELRRTESTVTPYVGKIVIKDNEAQAHAATQAEAQAITLTPAHLLSNRTHTLVYSFDGQRWRWNNGLRFSKIPSDSDTTDNLSQADLTAPHSGLAACLPVVPKD